VLTLPRAELAKIDAILRSLEGLRCLRTETGYGDELILHFGRLEARSVGWKSEPILLGEWRLGNRATETSVVGPSPVGQVVRSAKTTPKLGLVLGLEATTIEIAPARTDTRTGVAHWELFMPDGDLLSVGPGNEWKIGPQPYAKPT
jgi:hypothetical protein